MKLFNAEIVFNEAHRKYNISKPTLRRHFKGLNKNTKFVRQADVSSRKYGERNDETFLLQNRPALEATFFGLTATDLRKLAF